MNTIWEINAMKLIILMFATFVSFQTVMPVETRHAMSLPLHNYPKNYFQSPVAGDIRLSGSFGELRPNHFHAGIDIRHKEGRSGEPIFAAADGYIRRIKIQDKRLYLN